MKCHRDVNNNRVQIEGKINAIVEFQQRADKVCKAITQLNTQLLMILIVTQLFNFDAILGNL